VPHDPWKTLTFIAALRHHRVDAPCVIDGPRNGNLFTAYVEQVLGPTLQPGDVVILDNLGSHSGRRARRAMRGAGAHLPAYSPDMHPIEQPFAKLGHRMRAAEPRTVGTTWRKVGAGLDLISPAECAKHLMNSGDASEREKHALKPSAFPCVQAFCSDIRPVTGCLVFNCAAAAQPALEQPPF
jgi:transposase